MARWLLFLYALLPFYTRAQQNSQYLFRHIDQKDGLLHNTVSSIAQDQKGFIWIAAANGIQRFDGVRFTNYENNLKAFSYSPVIRNLFADANNNIWITSSQLASINTLTGLAAVYNEQEILHNPRFKFETYSDSRHHKWLLCPFALYYEDSLTRKMKLYSTCIPKEKSELGNTIFRDSLRHCTWVTDHDNFMLFDEKTKMIYTPAYNPAQNPVLKAFANKSVSFLFIDSQQNIWAAEWGSVINKYDERLKTAKEYYPFQRDSKSKKAAKDFTITTLCIYQDSRGAIWMGNDRSGLFRYDRSADSIEMIAGKNNQQKGLEYNYAFLTISEDRDGNLWLGTDKGISIFNPYQQLFFRIAHQENNSSSLPEDAITSFLQAKNGSYFIGTWGGGFSLYDSSMHFQKNVSPKGVAELSLVWSFAENDDGKIWAGAQHGYLHIYDPVTGMLKTIRPVEMQDKTIRCINKDSNGNLWFGLQNGKIVKWEKLSRRFYTQPENGIKNRSPVRNIFLSGSRWFWVSTDDGLLQFDPATLQYLGCYRPAAKNALATGGKEMHGIEQKDDSVLFVGTVRYGLYLFNIHTKEFRQEPAFSNLPATTIYALKNDAENNLWMTSDYNLYELRTKDGKLMKHELPGGLVNSAFELYNFYALQNGNWLTASKTEAVMFNTDALNISATLKKKVWLTGLKVFHKEIALDSLLQNGQPVNLNYDQNFITLEFTTHSYLGMAEPIFYKLSGLDKDWVKADEKDAATYTNLAPGRYVFNVKSGDESANSIVTSITIIVTPPFYRRWWFEALAALAVAFAVYFVMKKRIENIRYKAGLKHKIAETEMMALRSQMNPHFIFNCLSAIDNLIQTNQPDKATTYLARFAKLIRSVLDSTKNNLVPFYKDFESLRLYIELEQFSAENKFSYVLHADHELLDGDYKVPPLIVQPFAENAIHHGLLNKFDSDRMLNINVSLEEKFICYTVSDNGVGRKRAMEIKRTNKPEQASYGIEITEERITLHNRNHKAKGFVSEDLTNYISFKDLEEGGVPSGTQVKVYIRYDQ